MSARRVILVASAALALGAWQPQLRSNHAVQGAGGCEPSGGLSLAVRGFARKFVADTTAGGVASRARLKMPQMARAAAAVVSDDSLCKRAASLINGERRTPNAARMVFLIQAGNFYFVEDTSVHAGEWRPVYVLNKDMSKVLDKLLS